MSQTGTNPFEVLPAILPHYIIGSFISCLALSQSGEEEPLGRVFTILSASIPAPLHHCCAHPAPILPALRGIRISIQEHWALVLPTGASIPSCVQCSSPLPCTQRLVAILLLLWLHRSPQAKPSSKWLARGQLHGARAPLQSAWTEEPSQGAGLPVPGL